MKDPFKNTPLLFKAMMLAVLVVGLDACAVSPTGRSQLMLVNDRSIAPQAALSFEKMKKDEKITRRDDVNHYVQCVALPLVATARERYPELPMNWDIVVFDSATVNAFAMPGGKIGVYTGLLDITENPDQLAAVLGHEIGHVMAHHSAERMSQAQMIMIGMTAAGVVFANNRDHAMIMAALGLGATVGIQLPFSRTHEAEADQIGEDLMAKAGFDPAQSIRLWEIMEKKGGSRPPELLSTHPDPENRARRLEDLLQQTAPEYRAAVAAGKHPQCGSLVKPVTSTPDKQSKPKTSN